jgi:hypothetical protein
MARKRAKWTKHVLKLKAHHQWRARPGYKIFVADRGAVRFDFPEGWVVLPGEDSIKFHDKAPPDDDCTLQLSVMRLPPEVDWSGLPLGFLLRESTAKDGRDVFARGEVVEERRHGIELAWLEVRFRDPTQGGREAHSRTCLARGANIQPLITFDFWADDAPRLSPVWDEVLRSLRLNVPIDDPTFGEARRG